MKPATIYDVAREASVSHQTVTRYLNGFEGIRPATKERVQAALEALNYKPNGAARWLRSKQSNRIGILAHQMDQGGPGRIVAGASAAARRRGYVLDIASMDGEDVDSVDAALDIVMEHQIAGVFATAQTDVVRAAVVRRVAEVPIVLDVNDDSTTSKSIRRMLPGQLAAEHLFELGHRRVGFVGGPPVWVTAGDRRGSFVDRAKSLGMVVRWVVEGDWSAESGYRVAHDLVSGVGGVTAVCLANDSMAVGLIFGLAEHGIRVPDDLSVIGMDDAPESRFHLPSLSTIRLDFEGDGALAMDALIDRIESRERSSTVEHTLPQLIKRSSTRSL